MAAKRSDPWIPVGHPDFKWTSGADVQKLWRKYGWVPPSELRKAPLPLESKEPEWMVARRVK
jgi:hypothetical protein